MHRCAMHYCAIHYYGNAAAKGMVKFMNFKITGTGSYVPERVVTNDELSGMVETSDEWISQRVGIHERRIATNETTVDMAERAGKAALEAAGVKPEELDLILTSTVSGEYSAPSTACMVQKRLGATCLAYEINAACSAFLFLLETAAGYFARGKVKKALLIGTEKLSRIIDWQDRSTCVIFGDGAGAVVLEAGENYLDSTFEVEGNDEVIRIPHWHGESPFDTTEVERPFIHMAGQETFKFAVSSITRDVKLLLERNSLTSDDIKYIVPHQANARIIDTAARRLKLPQEKFYLNIDRLGNTSSASIPIALDELARSGKLERGDRIIFSAFGGGLSAAAALLVW